MSSNDTNIPTPRTDALQHGGERLDRLAKELSDVDEVCYRAAVEELYMDAAAELAAARAENAALRKDSERLDWLASQEARLLNNGGYFLYWGDTDDTGGEWQTGRFDSPRAAIDAAMEGGER